MSGKRKPEELSGGWSNFPLSSWDGKLSGRTLARGLGQGPHKGKQGDEDRALEVKRQRAKYMLVWRPCSLIQAATLHVSLLSLAVPSKAPLAPTDTAQILSPGPPSATGIFRTTALHAFLGPLAQSLSCFHNTPLTLLPSRIIGIQICQSRSEFDKHFPI